MLQSEEKVTLFGPRLILLLSGNFQRPKAMDTTLPTSPPPPQKKKRKKEEEGNEDSNLNVSIENTKKSHLTYTRKQKWTVKYYNF